MMFLVLLFVPADLPQSTLRPCEVPRSQVQNGRVVTDTVKVPVSKAPPVVEYTGPIRAEPTPPSVATWELWHYTDGSVRWTLVNRPAPIVESYPVPYRAQPMPARIQPSFAAQIQIGQFQAGACYGST